MAKIIFKPNPFEKDEIYFNARGKTITDCVNDFLFIRRDLVPHFFKGRFDVVLNDISLPNDLSFMNLLVYDEDEIYITPSVGTEAMAIYAIVTLIVSMILSYISYRMMAEDLDEMQNEKSKTYGFDKNVIMEEGDPIQLNFGTIQVVPAVIGSYIETPMVHDRKYMKAGADTFTISLTSEVDFTNTFTVTPAIPADPLAPKGIISIDIPFIMPGNGKMVDTGYGDEVWGGPTLKFEYNYKPEGGDWVGKQSWYNGEHLQIHRLDPDVASYEIEIKVKGLMAYMEHSNTYDEFGNITGYQDDYQDFQFVDYDNISCDVYYNSFSIASTTQHLNLLLAWGEGVIEGVREIYINDLPLSDYQDDEEPTIVRLEHRYGTDDQTAVEDFSSAVEAVSTETFPIELTEANPVSPSISMTATDCSSITIGFKSRIFEVTNSGVKDRSVSVKIEVSVYGSGVWTILDNSFEMTSKDTNFLYYSRKYSLETPGRYTMRITRLSPDAGGDDGDSATVYWQYFNAYSLVGYTYPGTALTSVKFIATEKISGGMPTLRGVVLGIIMTVPRIQVSSETVDFCHCYYDPYSAIYRIYDDTDYTFDVACDGLTSNTETQWTSNPFWIYYNCLINEEWGYGDRVGVDKVSFSDIMTAGKWADELVIVDEGGTGKEITSALTTFTSTTVTVTGASWEVDEHKNKYVRVAMVSSPVYSSDYQIRKIVSNTSDQITVLQWSTTPTNGFTIDIVKQMKKRFSFDGTLDKFVKVVDWFKSLLFIARANPVLIGTTYSVACDKQKLLSDTIMLTAGNVLDGSFSEQMQFKKPTHYTCSYLNAADFYKRAYHGVTAPDWTILDKRYDVNYDFFGITDTAHAMKMLEYLRNKDAYCSRTAVSKGMLDSILALPSERVKFSHPRPEWGWSGRVVDAGTDANGDYLTLDAPVTIEAATVYLLYVRVNELITEYEVDESLTGIGEVTTLYITTTWSSVPTAFEDLWILVNDTDNIEAKDFTIEGLKRSNENVPEFFLLEYNDSVYSDEEVVPTEIVSGLVHKKLPALAGLDVHLDWVLDLSTHTWAPHIFLSFELDQTAAYRSKIVKGRVFGSFRDGNVASRGVTDKGYDFSFDVDQLIINYPAKTLHDKTLFVNAALINESGGVGYLMSEDVVFYIDTSWAPPIGVNTVTIDWTNTDFYKDFYSIVVYWDPAGWRLNDSLKYEPIVHWNNGDNYYNYKKYVIAWAIVSDNGIYPDLDKVNIFERDVGNILKLDGTPETDEDILNDICLKSSSIRVDNMPYGTHWICFTVAAILADGRLAIDASNSPTYGLDWDWLQVKAPGGPGNTVEDIEVTNFEVYYNAQPGLVDVTEIHWDYMLEAPDIDGFAFFVRYQPFFWGWELSTTLPSNATSFIPNTYLDLTLENKENAFNHLITIMSVWKAEGRPYCFFMISDGVKYEVIRCNLALTNPVISPPGTWVVERGMEGTTAGEFLTGASFFFSPSEYTDNTALYDIPSARSFPLPQPVRITWAVHLTMCAYKLISEAPGYLRSYYAYPEAINQG